MGICVAYMRVSTKKQVDEGFGLDLQKNDIIEYAQKTDMVISKWYVDEGITGMSMDAREQLQEMISDINILNITDIIVFKVDRLARDGIDALWMIGKLFKPKGVTVHSVHDFSKYETPMDKFQTSIMSAVAEYDHDMIVLKMRAGMLERVKQGFWMGGGNLPFAYSYNPKTNILEQIPEKAKMVKQAAQLYMQGYSDAKVAEIVGLKNDSVTRTVLSSKVNAGLIPYKGNDYKGLHEPILSVEEWQALQDERKRRSSIRTNWTNKPCYILSGLCFCGYCGARMRYMKWKVADTPCGNRKWSNGQKLWCCSHAKNAKMHYKNVNSQCLSKAVDAVLIENQIVEEIKKISIQLSGVEKSERQSKAEILTENLNRENAKLKRLYGLYADDADQNLLQVIDETKNKIKNIEKEIELDNNDKNKEERLKAVAETASHLADVWDELDNVKKNRILKTFIRKIVINGVDDISVYLYI